jgi:osmotically-inducible protein OsmY
MKQIAKGAAIVAVVVAATWGCSRKPDTRDHVNQALKDANLSQVQVDYDRDAGVVHLKGSVDTPTDRNRAEEVATAAVGTTGKVLNELTVKGLNDQIAGKLDDDIKDALKKMVDRNPQLKDRDINFKVNNGVVTVTGEVTSAAEKNQVTQLVKSAPGVKDMANELEIKPKKSTGQ